MASAKALLGAKGASADVADITLANDGPARWLDNPAANVAVRKPTPESIVAFCGIGRGERASAGRGERHHARQQRGGRAPGADFYAECGEVICRSPPSPAFIVLGAVVQIRRPSPCKCEAFHFANLLYKAAQLRIPC